MARLHTTPSTRVRISSGTSRCRSVKAATSSTLFAAPTTASRTTAAVTVSGQKAISAIGTPQNTSAIPNGTASLRPPSVIAPIAPNSPPTPDRGGHVADLLRAAVEDAECGDDDEDVEAAAHEGLGDDEADDEARPGCARDGAEAGGEHPPHAALVRCRREAAAPLDTDPSQKHRAEDEEAPQRPRTPGPHPRPRRGRPRAAARRACRGSRSSTSHRSPRSAPQASGRATAAAPAAPA